LLLRAVVLVGRWLARLVAWLDELVLDAAEVDGDAPIHDAGFEGLDDAALRGRPWAAGSAVCDVAVLLLLDWLWTEPDRDCEAD